MDDLPLPEITPLNEPYWKGLESGELKFQRCANGHAWLPARDECPHCLTAKHVWERASGRGKLLSWVVYRTAYHPAFKDRLPYVVAVVELEEGPRLMTNIVPAGANLALDMPVSLTVEREGGCAVARFAPA